MRRFALSCLLATGATAGPQPIALDSPIKVTPSS